AGHTELGMGVFDAGKPQRCRRFECLHAMWLGDDDCDLADSGLLAARGDARQKSVIAQRQEGFVSVADATPLARSEHDACFAHARLLPCLIETSSARIDTAISCGVSAPMSRPIGARNLCHCGSSTIPLAKMRFRKRPTLPRLPMRPRYSHW